MNKAATKFSFWSLEDVGPEDTSEKLRFFKLVASENEGAELPYKSTADRLNEASEKARLEGAPSDPMARRIRGEYIRRLRELAERIALASDPQRTGQTAFDEDQIVLELGRAKGTYETKKAIVFRPEIAYLDPPDPPSRLHFKPLHADATIEQQALLVEIMRARTIVDIVLDKRLKRPSWTVQMSMNVRAWFGIGGSLVLPRNHHDVESSRLLYLRELKSIADEGLSSGANVGYAQHRLSAFKDSFVSREADVVKNHYVRKLGFSSFACAAGILALGVALLTVFHSSMDRGSTLLTQNFVLLAAAACGGTWLSFSLRRVVLGFTDLAALEDDRLNPFSRVIFVVLLTCVLALLLQTGLVVIQIGENAVWAGEAEQGALLAILLGALCGIAERSLSGAISKRADDVVGGSGQYARAASGAG